MNNPSLKIEAAPVLTCTMSSSAIDMIVEHYGETEDLFIDLENIKPYEVLALVEGHEWNNPYDDEIRLAMNIIIFFPYLQWVKAIRLQALEEAGE